MLDAHFMDWSGLNSHFLGQLEHPVKRLRDFLRKDRGARIGEASVVSRKVHTMRPEVPEEVEITTNSDAGEIFYQRELPGEIVHIDIFHELGRIDPVKVAIAIRKAIEAYNFHVTMQKFFLPTQHILAHCADFIDIQTAVGGGRITGNLCYGQKNSLRRAHENHVHIAALIPDTLLPLVFYIVLAVEKEIMGAGLEIRCNQYIRHVTRSGSGTSDLSPYTTNSDSYLQQTRPQSSEGNSHRQMRLAGDLLQEFQDVHELEEVLESFQGDLQGKKLQNRLHPYGDADKITQKLKNMGLVEQAQNKLWLSAAGRELKEFLIRHAPEIEAQVRNLTRQMPIGSGNGTSAYNVDRRKNGYGPTTGEAKSISVRQWATELSVSDTVIQALKRGHYEGRTNFGIRREDLRERQRSHIPGQEICLLIDASASMSGARIQASKYLVKHLLLTGRGRIAVVVFQEKGAKVEVPFTRDYRQIELGLKNLRAYGATPLARGITHTIQYLHEVYLKNPSILLITDGVPTVGEQTKDAVQDAIVAAQKIKERNIHFSCIGLQPHQRYLQQVTEAAGGTMYAVEELEKNLLLQIAWQDKVKREN
jgi:magnesium chelatase subunit D